MTPFRIEALAQASQKVGETVSQLGHAADPQAVIDAVVPSLEKVSRVVRREVAHVPGGKAVVTIASQMSRGGVRMMPHPLQSWMTPVVGALFGTEPNVLERRARARVPMAPARPCTSSALAAAQALLAMAPEGSVTSSEGASRSGESFPSDDASDWDTASESGSAREEGAFAEALALLLPARRSASEVSTPDLGLEIRLSRAGSPEASNASDVWSPTWTPWPEQADDAARLAFELPLSALRALPDLQSHPIADDDFGSEFAWSAASSPRDIECGPGSFEGPPNLRMILLPPRRPEPTPHPKKELETPQLVASPGSLLVELTPGLADGTLRMTPVSGDLQVASLLKYLGATLPALPKQD